MTNETIKSLLIMMYQKEFDVNNYVSIYDTKEQKFAYYADFEYTLAQADIITEIGLVIEGVIYKSSGTDYFYNPEEDGRCGENQGEGVFVERYKITSIKVFKNDVLMDLKITVQELGKKLELC